MVRGALGGLLLLLASSGAVVGFLSGNETQLRNTNHKVVVRGEVEHVLVPHVEATVKSSYQISPSNDQHHDFIALDRFSSDITNNSVEPSFTNEPRSKDFSGVNDPKFALRGIYFECVFRLDYPCIQRKALRFVETLGRANQYPLLPFLTIVRTYSDEKLRHPLEETRLADPNLLDGLIDEKVDRFFDEHVFRLELPRWMRDIWLRNDGSRSSKNHIDFFFGDYIEDGRRMDNAVIQSRGEGRTGEARMGCSSCKKKGVKLKKKGLKKCLMMLCAVVAGASMLLLPLKMGLIKIIAVKALLLALGAKLMALGMMLKNMMKGKGMMMMMKGGGGGWSDGGGGGGGWDASGGGGGGGWDQGGGGGGGGWNGGGGGGGPYKRSVPDPYSSYYPPGTAA